MPRPIIPPVITQRECPLCREHRPLVDFRRMAGSKRVLHRICNVCDPEKKLSEMTPAQRLRAMENKYPRALAHIVERMNERDQAAARAGQSLAAARRHQSIRSKAWHEALLTPLSRELAWAQDALRSAQGADSRYGWAAFFEGYVSVLKDAQRQALQQLKARQHRVAAPVLPPPEDVDIHTYVFPESIAALRKAYAVCKPIPGRRMYRDPWCLSW